MMPEKLYGFVLLAATVNTLEFPAEQECPEECDCNYFGVNYVTDCSESNLTGIPHGEISLNAYILDKNDFHGPITLCAKSTPRESRDPLGVMEASVRPPVTLSELVLKNCNLFSFMCGSLSPQPRLLQNSVDSPWPNCGRHNPPRWIHAHPGRRHE